MKIFSMSRLIDDSVHLAALREGSPRAMPPGTRPKPVKVADDGGLTSKSYLVPTQRLQWDGKAGELNRSHAVSHVDLPTQASNWSSGCIPIDIGF